MKKDQLAENLKKLASDLTSFAGVKPEPAPEPSKPKPKLQLRRKYVDGQAYIHADDVAALLEAASIQSKLAASLRTMKGGS